ncbi:hypothetical protein POM88_000062 [Heracleum sosnowskyi]|uniref:Pentatricopeptide repeat-containing protein n=1 Tax=Heracleum sosnowskyi TaxID=360622 RepID=A0AAD8N8Z9_9APIA|nr:hypothetical protein POM88_000062 [Heracleum sosnowskyi]
MNTRNIFPNVRTFSILVDAYGKEGMVKDAEDVIEFMIRRGHYPNVVTYNSLMDGYCLRGQVDKALAVLETTMKTRGIVPNTRLTPTIETYNTILQGSFHTGRHVEAQIFFKEKMMLNKGLEIKLIIGILERNVQLKALRLSAEDSSMQNSLDPIQGETMTLRSCTWRSIDITGMATVGQ